MKISDLIGIGISHDAQEWLEKACETLQSNGSKIGDVSDGYHTYNELYNHRAMEFAVICNAYPWLAWKSMQHDDPDFPMYDGMFIVGINTPLGQATYHYDIDPWWYIFGDVDTISRAPRYDGHTPDDVIVRLESLIKTNGWISVDDAWTSIPHFKNLMVYCPETDRVYIAYYDGANRWIITDNSGRHHTINKKVTHWKYTGNNPKV